MSKEDMTMGLLNDVKAADAVKANDGVKADAKAKGAVDKSEKKAKAKERKAAKRDALKHVLDYLAKNPIAELAEDVKKLTVVERTGGFAPSLTPEKLFGEDLKKGTSISAVDVFTKFQKGYPEMRKFIKKWAEKGVTVELDAKTQSYVLR